MIYSYNTHNNVPYFSLLITLLRVPQLQNSPRTCTRTILEQFISQNVPTGNRSAYPAPTIFLALGTFMSPKDCEPSSSLSRFLSRGIAPNYSQILQFIMISLTFYILNSQF